MNKAERKRSKDQQISEKVVKIVQTAVVAKKAVVKHRDKIDTLLRQIKETKQTEQDKTTTFTVTTASHGSKDGTKGPERKEKTTVPAKIESVVVNIDNDKIQRRTVRSIRARSKV